MAFPRLLPEFTLEPLRAKLAAALGPGTVHLHPTQGEGMADAVTGTNTEKIDRLVGQVAALAASIAEVKAQLRLVQGLSVLTIPLLVAFGVHLVNQVSAISGDLKVVSERLRRSEDDQRKFEKEIQDQRERLIRLEAAQGKKL